MKRKIKLQEKRRVWKRTDYVKATNFSEDAEGNQQVKVTVEVRSYVCPWCNKKKEYTIVNGQIIHGVGGTFVSDVEYCGSRECDKKVDKYLSRDW
jgi:hypothetical protein